MDAPETGKVRQFYFPPSIEEAQRAYTDLGNVLKPSTKNGQGFRHPKPGLDKIVAEWLSAMKLFCFNYADMQKKKPNSPQWQAASLQTAKSLGGNTYMAQSLCEWTCVFIGDPEFMPEHHHNGKAGCSLLDDDDFAQELHLHLQSMGKYCTTKDIVQYIAQPEVLAKLNRTKTISHTTAHRWMKKMGYHWTSQPRGQYADGYERLDVVEYRNKVFLPAVQELEGRTRTWGSDGQDETAADQVRHVVFWFHDESTFYAHDRQKKQWVHKLEKVTPYAKGEGHSLMVADFVSADYGWLWSPDGGESARVLFKAGKAREGYFDNESIQAQTAHAMDILTRHHPYENHVLIFDNVTTHLK